MCHACACTTPPTNPHQHNRDRPDASPISRLYLSWRVRARLLPPAGAQAVARPPQSGCRGLPTRPPQRPVGPLQQPQVAARACQRPAPLLPRRSAQLARGRSAGRRPPHAERPRGRLARVSRGPSPGPHDGSAVRGAPRVPRAAQGGQGPAEPCGPATLGMTGTPGTRR